MKRAWDRTLHMMRGHRVVCYWHVSRNGFGDDHSAWHYRCDCGKDWPW